MISTFSGGCVLTLKSGPDDGLQHCTVVDRLLRMFRLSVASLNSCLLLRSFGTVVTRPALGTVIGSI